MECPMSTAEPEASLRLQVSDEGAGENSTKGERRCDTDTCKEPGVAMIKPEFIVLDHKMTLSKYLPQHISEQIAVETTTKRPNDNQKDNTEEGPPAKKAKLKGRFKKRPREKRLLFANKVCPAVVREESCSFGEKCRFTHDVKQFLEDNPPREGDCYVYTNFGRCPFGVTCLHAGQHLSGDNKNITNNDLVKKYDALPARVTNVIPRDVARLLSRRQYDFQLSDSVVKLVQKGERPDSSDFVAKRPSEVYRANESTEHTNAGASTNDNEKSEPLTASCNVNEGLATRGISSNNPTEDSSNHVSNAVKIETNCGSKVGSLIEESDKRTAGSDNTDTRPDSPADVAGVSSGASLLSASCTSNETDVQSISQSTDNDLGKVNTKVPSTTPLSMLDCEGIRLRPQEKNKVAFRDKLYLAPLTTVGNLPFRRICKEFGADITCSEMATCTGLLQGSMSEWALMKRHHTEDIFGAQICGAYPDTMTRCTQVLMENTDVDFIDVNLGCPIDLFFKKGEGCALMGKASKLETILSSMRALMNVPLTVKMRTGIFEDKPIAHKLIQRVNGCGVSLVTIHGRSREQRYTRLADWQYINQCCSMANSTPVFGCGDILSYDDYRQKREETGVAGCMIARGALIKPWIFTEIKEERDWDISSSERFDMLKRFTNYGLEHWGSDAQGVANTRKFLLEWLSFLHRYIPVGLLSRPPQRINEKPPRFVGRNDLETLMASRNCGDWVKISEMLLGTVPDGFEFVPKHKANAYS